MRILFDQATPVPIRPHLEGHEVRTAAQEGDWGTQREQSCGRARNALEFSSQTKVESSK